MNDDRNLDFVRQIVLDDVNANTHGGRVLTRFPPEPNGYLHIGHAAAIFLDFGAAAEHDGITTLRMDDTNPTTEDPRFVEAIAEDIRWLIATARCEVREKFGVWMKPEVKLLGPWSTDALARP